MPICLRFCCKRNRQWKHRKDDRRFAQASYGEPITLAPSRRPSPDKSSLSRVCRSPAFLERKSCALPSSDEEHARTSGETVDICAARAHAGSFARCFRLHLGAAGEFFGCRRARLRRAGVQSAVFGDSCNAGTGSQSCGDVVVRHQAGGDERQSALGNPARSTVGDGRTTDLLGLAAAAAARG